MASSFGVHGLSWDEPGDRQYRTGLDRGVLYPQVGSGVPWNGLVSVVDGNSREVKPSYMDGIKYLDHEVVGEWQGKLTAFTYPDILDELLGVHAFAPGLFAHEQPSKTFNLSYRTQIGDDISGDDAGYIIHVLFNIRAVSDDLTHTTRGSSTDPEVFSWTLSATPPVLSGLRPTAHISVDSRKIAPAALALLEARLYGSDTFAPVLAAKDLPALLNQLAEAGAV